MDAIETVYRTGTHFHQLYGADTTSQHSANQILREQQLNIKDLGDLGNRWSKRWSQTFKRSGSMLSHVLLQW